MQEIPETVIRPTMWQNLALVAGFCDALNGREGQACTQGENQSHEL